MLNNKREQLNRISLDDILRALVPHSTYYTDLTVSIFDAFSGWENVIPFLEEGNFVVVFESKRRVDADLETLERLDESAHKIAAQSPGYKGYFQGQIDKETRICRSFCIWENIDSSRFATTSPEHREAMQVAIRMYDLFNLRRFLVRKNNALDIDGCILQAILPNMSSQLIAS